MEAIEQRKTKPKKRKVGVLEKFNCKPCDKAGKIAVIYVRVSTDDMIKNQEGKQERRASSLVQIEDGIALAKKEGWQWLVLDKDCDISGAADLSDRPALQELIDLIQAGKVHTVIIRESKRLFRNKYEQAAFVHKILLPNGVALKGTNEEIDIFSPEGQLMLDLKGYMAQADITFSASRSKRSRQHLVEKGKLLVKPSTGYGINVIGGIRQTVIIPKEAEIIKRFFAWALAGIGQNGIAKKAANEGIKSRNSKFYSKNHITKMLRNPVYIGQQIYNGKVYPSLFPPLLSVEDWLKVQTILKEKEGTGKGNNANTHLLTGLLKCGYCFEEMEKGNKERLPNMVFHRKSYTTRHGKKVAFENYCCQTSEKYGAKHCHNISIQEGKIEMFLKDYCEYQATAKAKELLPKSNNGIGELVTAINRQETALASLVNRQKQIKARYANDLIKEIDYDDMMAISKATILKAETALAGQRQQLDALTNNSQAKALKDLSGWDGLTMKQKKAGLRGLFSKLLLYRDRLVIYWHGALVQEVAIIQTRGRKGSGYDFDKSNPFEGGTPYRFSTVPLPTE